MKKTIHYALILDNSGSMQTLRQDVISSFNEQVEMILKLKKEEPDSIIKLTLCIFNNAVEFKFIDQDIDRVAKLTPEDYRPDSLTALFDAIGSCFVKINELVQQGDQVFFAIFTDGLENASQVYTGEDINYKFKTAEEKGWGIKFFCRYEDQLSYKNRLHISAKNVVGMSMDMEGLRFMDNEIGYCLKELVKNQKQPT